MSKMLNAMVGLSLGCMIAAPSYAMEPQHTEAWSDAQIDAARAKCQGLKGTEGARCFVNIRPAGGGGSSVAVSVPDATDNGSVVRAAGDEDYVAEMKRCDSTESAMKERCIADVRDHFGRM
ncbi:MAG TPA: hypothetical protein VFV71_03010 [Burkholderiales bacterium]|nr:hypothetical protein [Burkholderiales bacterium]